jgi:hypothetical protein
LSRILALLVAGSLLSWSSVQAKTPDGKPPSEEAVCDSQTGAAFGLCNAYCEAMDCDSPDHQASDTGCAQVKANYERETGRPLPCEVVCPCGQQLPLFADLVSGAIPAQDCIADAQILSVSTPQGNFVVVNSAAVPPFCSVNLEPPFVELTQSEVVACRDLLRKAAAAQAVVCTSPE